MLDEFLKKEGIEVYATLRAEDAKVLNPSLYDRLFSEAKPCALVVFLIPYDAKVSKRNLSRYAVGRDYHEYVRGLSERAKGAFSTCLCALSDHSPFDERDLALSAGLGMRGEHGLLIHERYGSYVFIGTLCFSEPISTYTERAPYRECLHCGACGTACPMRREGCECLSFLSQKKRITVEEERLLDRYGILWGCDLCQEACPLNRDAAPTPIPFFQEELIPVLDSERLREMLSDGSFSQRAYAWRGREVLSRSLERLEKGTKRMQKSEKE